MQRPVMNPMDVAQPARAPRWKIPWKKIWIGVKFVGRVLLSDPMDLRKQGLRIEDGSRLQRLLQGILYRVAFIPVLVMLAVAALVYVGTHPRPIVGQLDPSAVGVYFEPVEFASDSATRLQGWLVPAVDARKILAEHERALHQKSPAVVLVHGYGTTRSQMLPLIRPLHDAGFIVLVVAVRGAGTSDALGETFGVNEAQDVHAALEMLRRRPGVDVDRLSAVGVGTGANAVLLNADRDSSLVASVLDSPIFCGDDAIAEFVAPHSNLLKWMKPLCKWAFEIAYEKDLDEIGLERHKLVVKSSNVLTVEDQGFQTQVSPVTVTRVVKYLQKKLDEKKPNEQIRVTKLE